MACKGYNLQALSFAPGRLVLKTVAMTIMQAGARDDAITTSVRNRSAL